MNESTATPLREQLKALENLQELDHKIDQLKKNKNAVPAALKGLDDGVAKSLATLTIKKSAIAEIEKIQKQTSAAMDLNKDRLARANSKYESVQNTHEYQAASKEMDQLRKLSLSLEDQMKKSAVELERCNTELAELVAQSDKLKGERDDHAEKLGAQVAKLEQEISALMGERTQYTSRVEGRVLNNYDRVRSARGGIGIVPAVGGRCKGCNMVVPPQLYNEVQKTLAVQCCPSCHRILFAPAPAQTGVDVNSGT